MFCYAHAYQVNCSVDRQQITVVGNAEINHVCIRWRRFAIAPQLARDTEDAAFPFVAGPVVVREDTGGGLSAPQLFKRNCKRLLLGSVCGQRVDVADVLGKERLEGEDAGVAVVLVVEDDIRGSSVRQRGKLSHGFGLGVHLQRPAYRLCGVERRCAAVVTAARGLK